MWVCQQPDNSDLGGRGCLVGEKAYRQAGSKVWGYHVCRKFWKIPIPSIERVRGQSLYYVCHIYSDDLEFLKTVLLEWRILEMYYRLLLKEMQKTWN